MKKNIFYLASWYSIPIFFTFLTLLWVFYSGKDISWDVVNHHFYLPFSWVTGRIESDFYGAGPQAYQNPIGYLPFYYMVSSGWPELIIGIIFTLCHSIVFFILWALCFELWSESKERLFWSILSLSVVWITPLFLQIVGTSSIDPITAIFVLCSIYLIVISYRLNLIYSYVSGFLIGLAFAFKQSNAVYVIAAIVVLLWQWYKQRTTFKAIFLYTIGVVTSILLGMGWWVYKLWNKFENPLFPLYNNIFKSPFAPSSEPLLTQRFVPSGFYDWIMRPWDMLLIKQYTYVEFFSPDVKLFVFCCLFFIGFFLYIKNKINLSFRDQDVLVFFFVSYFLWLATSGNGRYGFPLLLILGVLLVRSVYIIFSAKAARILILIVLIIQSFIFISEKEFRIRAIPWNAGPYYDVRIPSRLLDEPFLHLSVGLQSYASVAAFLNEKGELMNIIGQISLPSEGKVGDHVLEKIRKWEGRTRILFEKKGSDNNFENLNKGLSFSYLLYSFGLDINTEDCEIIDLVYNKKSLFSMAGDIDMNKDDYRNTLLSCGVFPTKRNFKKYNYEKEISDHVFNIIEGHCPKIFSPAKFSPSIWTGDAWQRYYPNSDTVVNVSLLEGVFVHHSRVLGDIRVGTIDEILQGKANIWCEKISVRTPD